MYKDHFLYKYTYRTDIIYEDINTRILYDSILICKIISHIHS